MRRSPSFQEQSPGGQGPHAGLAGAIARLPLRYPDFRLLWLSSIFTGFGYVGESVVLGWLLLERTDSPSVVGLGIALRALPNFVLGIPGGALADRVDRRLLLRLIGFASAVISGVLALLALTEHLAVWHILFFTFLGGTVRSVGQAARQSYAFDIVGPAQVIGGMAFMNLGQRTGGIAGSLSAGLLIGAAGAGEAYLALALCQMLGALTIMLARTRGQAAPVSRPPVWQGVREYIEELRANRTLSLVVLLTAAVEVFGFSHQTVMPSLARDLLEVGPEGLGLLNAFASCGGMAAILLVSLRGELAHKGLSLLAVLVCFGAALILLGAGGSLTIALAAITLVSALAALTDLLTQSLVQSVVANDLRGRAMGSWVLATGLGPVGHVQIGGLAAVSSVTLALMTNGVLLIALALGTLIAARRIRRL